MGVLTLYRADADAFAPDHLRILSGISSKIGLSFENALKYRALEASATTDYLTGLNNTRALFERLNHETPALQTATIAPHGDGLRPGSFQGGERPFRSQCRKQGVAGVRQGLNGNQPGP